MPSWSKSPDSDAGMLVLNAALPDVNARVVPETRLPCSSCAVENLSRECKSKFRGCCAAHGPAITAIAPGTRGPVGEPSGDSARFGPAKGFGERAPELLGLATWRSNQKLKCCEDMREGTAMVLAVSLSTGKLSSRAVFVAWPLA